MMTDPIADLLTRIRNASRAEHEKVDMPVLQAQGADHGDPQGRGLHQELPLHRGAASPGTLPRVPQVRDAGTSRSSPAWSGCRSQGRRVYVGKDKIPSILGGMGVAILSTSRGVMTDREVRKQQLGGEVLAYVW